MAAEYMKLVSRNVNGRKFTEKIAEGSWGNIKAQNIPRGKDLELFQYIRGQRCVLASGTWDMIQEKMEGLTMGFHMAMEADAIPHIVFAVGLLAWGVFAMTILPYL